MDPITSSEKDQLAQFFCDDTSEAVVARATRYRSKPDGDGEPDPLPDVAPSLLSADDITRYVEKTGMIHPYSFQERKTTEKPKGVHRLKGASYEGRMGCKAYIFDPNQNEPRSILSRNSKFLTFPENSIVFVESDIYFRLPPFVAVRFNLQIHHVHRGLLLGTGPLVDPGFWGKLCIPIHNLTDEPYTVPVEEGLIWIEFTKTTAHPVLGKPPSNSNLEDIEEAIQKSSRPYQAVIDDAGRAFWGFGKGKPKKVGIRSSIDSALREARDTAKSAEKAAAGSRNLIKFISSIGIISIFFGSFLMYDLWTSYREAVTSYEDSIRSLSSQSTRELSNFTVELANYKSMVEALQRKVDAQAGTIESLNRQLDALPFNQ